MQRMWEKIHPETSFKEPRAYSHRREESRVWRVQNEIYKECKFKGSPAHSHGRDPLPVSSLSQEIQPEIELEETCPEKAPGPIRVRANIRMPQMSGPIGDKTRIGETCASSRSFIV